MTKLILILVLIVFLLWFLQKLPQTKLKERPINLLANGFTQARLDLAARFLAHSICITAPLIFINLLPIAEMFSYTVAFVTLALLIPPELVIDDNSDNKQVIEELLENLQKRNPSIPKNHLIQTDFFQWNETYDLILEQTFFCALDPNLRVAYAQKMASMLRPNGKLVGLFFDTDFANDFPPFGGNKEEYLSYFTPYFDIQNGKITSLLSRI